MLINRRNPLANPIASESSKNAATSGYLRTGRHPRPSVQVCRSSWGGPTWNGRGYRRAPQASFVGLLDWTAHHPPFYDAHADASQFCKRVTVKSSIAEGSLDRFDVRGHGRFRPPN